MKKAINTETVEFEVVTGGKDRFFFPTSNRFKGKKISGIEFLPGSTGQKTLSGNPIATASQLQNVYLTLDVNGREPVKDYPAALLTREALNGQIMEFEEIVVSEAKSGITISDLSAFSATVTSVVLIIYYKD